MCVLNNAFRGCELIVTFEAFRIVLRLRQSPFRTDRFVRAVAGHTGQLRIAASLARVGKLRGIPGRDSSRIVRTFSRMTSAANPIDVGVRSTIVDMRVWPFDHQILAVWREPWQSLRILDMCPAAKVAGFTTNSHRHGVLLL